MQLEFDSEPSLPEPVNAPASVGLAPAQLSWFWVHLGAHLPSSLTPRASAAGVVSTLSPLPRKGGGAQSHVGSSGPGCRCRPAPGQAWSAATMGHTHQSHPHPAADQSYQGNTHTQEKQFVKNNSCSVRFTEANSIK